MKQATLQPPDEEDPVSKSISCLHMTLEIQPKTPPTKSTGVQYNNTQDSQFTNQLDTKIQTPPQFLITSVSEKKLIDENEVPVDDDRQEDHCAFQLDLTPAINTASDECAYSETELREAMTLLMTRKKRPSEAMIPHLRSYLKRAIYQAIVEQNYDEAEYLKQVETRLNAQKEEDVNFRAEKTRRIKTVDDRINSMKEKIEEIKAKWTEKIEDFDREKKEKMDEIKTKHKAELDKFEEHWNSPTTMMAFTKPSPQLLQIRKLQKTSALANDFQRAKELKRKGDELEQMETQKATQKATTAMQIAYKNLREKQNKEIEFTTMNWRRQLVMMHGERDSELKQANLCLKQLQLKKDECKASKVRPLSCLTPKRKDPRGLTTPTTPRTRRQRADYRFISTQEKLTLMGFDVKDVVRTRRPSTGKRRSKSVTRPDLQL